MNIAVLDGGGHLKAFARMGGAVLGSIDVALMEAKTAVLFGMNSEAVGGFCKPGISCPGLGRHQRRLGGLRGRHSAQE